jgi:galactokinase
VALEPHDFVALGALLDASHASLRNLYECSTVEVEQAVARLHAAGAAGARMIGGGFGGHVAALFPPGSSPAPGLTPVWAVTGSLPEQA